MKCLQVVSLRQAAKKIFIFEVILFKNSLNFIKHMADILSVFVTLGGVAMAHIIELAPFKVFEYIQLGLA